MIDKRQVVRNAVLSVVQVVVTGVTFFFLYRYLLQALGAEEFGVWSIVLATTSASGVASLGLAAGSTKYVSQYIARDEPERVREVIETASLSVAAAVGLVLVLVYPLLRALLAFVIEQDLRVNQAHAILPYSLLSFWFTSVGLVFLSCVAGFQRVDLRAIAQSIAAVVYLVLAFVFVPAAGLIGIAQAQVAQASLLCIGGWLIVRHVFRRLSLVPIRWKWEVFREMLSYGVNLQIISVAQMLFEPTTTSLLSKFGGVGMVGYYEMARRMVVQLRALFATAHEALVPTIADVHERDWSVVPELYAKSFRILTFLIAPTLPLFIGLTPFVSEIWIGDYNQTFILFAVLLFCGWFVNMGSAPAYYANLGTGELRWNVIGHVFNGILNLGLGILLGLLFGGVGVVIGFVVSLVLASGLVAVPYELKYRVGARRIIDPKTLLVLGVSLLGMTFCFAGYTLLEQWHPVAVGIVVLASYAAVVLPFVLTHPLWPILTDAAGSFVAKQERAG